MTREEAILWLKNLRIKDFGWTDDSEETKDIRKQCEDSLFEAIDLAIEALSADSVSRKDTVTLNSPISIQADMVAVVRCKDCRHANECHKNVQYTRNELNTVTIGYSPIEWCSRGERKGGDTE